ncbi:Phage protein [Janthinobacterium sp. CG23_2]|nr:Phage protein [Janthinobacterium sp. CG23_2]CUU26399.1 Phage protein [Janthinobacterium sp. CG23_2]
MPIFKVPDAGAVGVIKDVSQHKLPPNAWTDASNMRFLDGSVRQFYGHGPVYGTPAETPLHVVPVNIGAARYWLYAGAQKIYAVTAVGGVDTHTNITRQTASVDVNYAGAPNAWTSTVLSGIPILNAGNLTDPPQRWNLNVANRCVTLDNWPAATFCKSMRAYKNFLVALHVTRAGQTFPYMVKWSHPADPGGVPISWDQNDGTKDAAKLTLPRVATRSSTACNYATAS